MRYAPAALLLITAISGSAQSPAPAPAPAMSPALEKAVGDRQPGAPVTCLALTPMLRSRIVDETAIIFSQGSAILYVTRPDAGCTSLKKARSLVLDMTRQRICAGDTVGVNDLTSDMDYGSCEIGPFVPYARVKK